MKRLKSLSVLVFLSFFTFQVSAQCNIGDILSSNGDFETGDLTDWVANDIASPFLAMQVACFPGSVGFGFETVTALDGSCYMINGFDGDGPGQITLHQDISIPTDAVAEFSWSEAIAYDLSTFGASIDRLYEVQVQPFGGGAPLEILYSFTAMAGTVNNGNGWTSHTADLSAYAGQDIRLCFVETVPESFSGPGQIAVDGVSVEIVACSTEVVPTLGEWGVIALMLIMMIFGTVAVRSRSVAIA